MERLGIVIIGRNEGERLRRCLASAIGQGYPVVYVDSGSTDGSCAVAEGLGADVITLDLSIPFTAARARNAGAERLLDCHPGMEYLQFIDGDCEFREGWLSGAFQALEAHPNWLAVCGRLRERYPARTVFNRLADLEWRMVPGPIEGCGGIVMMRVEAYLRAGRFNASIIASEDRELCFRMRRLGGEIVALDSEMAWHDIAMTRPVQWWRRAVRGGHGFAELCAMHGRGPERFRVDVVRRIVLWGAILPVTALALAWPTRGLSVVCWLALVALKTIRNATNLHRRESFAPKEAILYAMHCELAKVPQCIGLIRYMFNRLLKRGPKLIEYKGPIPSRPPTWPAPSVSGD